VANRDKNARVKKHGGPKPAKALTSKQVHARVSSLLKGKALRGEDADAFAAEMLAATSGAAAAIAVKPVSFTCSNFGCLVAITSGNIHFVFSGSGGANFPVGVSNIFYGVQGLPNQSFAITVQGGTLDFPINSQLTPQGKAGGMRQLKVSA
jgi:hypothetical protein